MKSKNTFIFLNYYTEIKAEKFLSLFQRLENQSCLADELYFF